MFGLGATELIIIALIILLIFGAKRIPEIGKGIGGAVREMKNIKKEMNTSSSKLPSEKAEESTESEDEAKIPSLIGEGIKKQVLNHVPIAKKAMAFTDKVKKVNEIIK